MERTGDCMVAETVIEKLALDGVDGLLRLFHLEERLHSIEPGSRFHFTALVAGQVAVRTAHARVAPS